MPMTSQKMRDFLQKEMLSKMVTFDALDDALQSDLIHPLFFTELGSLYAIHVPEKWLATYYDDGSPADIYDLSVTPTSHHHAVESEELFEEIEREWIAYWITSHTFIPFARDLRWRYVRAVTPITRADIRAIGETFAAMPDVFKSGISISFNAGTWHVRIKCDGQEYDIRTYSHTEEVTVLQKLLSRDLFTILNVGGSVSEYMAGEFIGHRDIAEADFATLHLRVNEYLMAARGRLGPIV